MYDQNHYFGLRPIPKPNTKLADTFNLYHKPITKTTFQRENLFNDSMLYDFSHKWAPKTQFAAKY